MTTYKPEELVIIRKDIYDILLKYYNKSPFPIKDISYPLNSFREKAYEKGWDDSDEHFAIDSPYYEDNKVKFLNRHIEL